MKLQELLDSTINYMSKEVNTKHSVSDSIELKNDILDIVNSITKNEPVLSIAIVKKCLDNKVVFYPGKNIGIVKFSNINKKLVFRINNTPNIKNENLQEEEVQLLKIINGYDPIKDYCLSKEEQTSLIDDTISEGIKRLDI